MQSNDPPKLTESFPYISTNPADTKIHPSTEVCLPTGFLAVEQKHFEGGNNQGGGLSDVKVFAYEQFHVLFKNPILASPLFVPLAAHLEQIDLRHVDGHPAFRHSTATESRSATAAKS